jgi:excisionase family DNA binding protein
MGGNEPLDGEEVTGRNGHSKGPRPREYLSYERVAAELDVSRKTVERMVRDGRLPAIRLGKRIMRISRDDLDSLLNSSMVGEDVGDLDPEWRWRAGGIRPPTGR